MLEFLQFLRLFLTQTPKKKRSGRVVTFLRAEPSCNLFTRRAELNLLTRRAELLPSYEPRRAVTFYLPGDDITYSKLKSPSVTVLEILAFKVTKFNT